ncbi:LysR substrate-binding domain-containing protein [Streptomyces atrovirens]|uniref:LysR substrate-binding domain-containing protein n=1 Tax=Streptomyces atrovirens TaxID=285556 RepID=A0ABW0DM49_9ACTN
MTDRAFTAAGLRRHVTIEITAIGAGADFVRHGLGVALSPRGGIEPDAGLVSLPVTGADLNWPVSPATPGNRAPSAAARAARWKPRAQTVLCTRVGRHSPRRRRTAREASLSACGEGRPRSSSVVCRSVSRPVGVGPDRFQPADDHGHGELGRGGQVVARVVH